jgi:hypothetical protein
VPIWSDDLRAGTPPAWMIELAEQVKLIEPELLRGAMLPNALGEPIAERQSGRNVQALLGRAKPGRTLRREGCAQPSS